MSKNELIAQFEREIAQTIDKLNQTGKSVSKHDLKHAETIVNEALTEISELNSAIVTKMTVKAITELYV